MSEDLKAEESGRALFDLIQDRFGIVGRYEDQWGEWAKVAAEYAALQAQPHAGGVEATDEIVSYIARYGGMCRDCADHDGVCPGSGMPCGESSKAIRHVLEALNYGLTNGFISTPPAHPEPVAWMCEDLILTSSEPRLSLDRAYSERRAMQADAWKVTPLYAHPAPAGITMQEALHPEGLSPKRAPRLYDPSRPDGKFSEAFVFEGGSLTVQTQGHERGNGMGWFCFPEEEITYDNDTENGKTYVVVRCEPSEFIALRDQLNKLWPPLPNREGE